MFMRLAGKVSRGGRTGPEGPDIGGGVWESSAGVSYTS